MSSISLPRVLTSPTPRLEFNFDAIDKEDSPHPEDDDLGISFLFLFVFCILTNNFLYLGSICVLKA